MTVLGLGFKRPCAFPRLQVLLPSALIPGGGEGGTHGQSCILTVRLSGQDQLTVGDPPK